MADFEKKLIEVCAECSQASCYHGEFMCFEARTAGTELKTVRELRKLAHENPDNWSDEKLNAVYGEPAPNGYEAKKSMQSLDEMEDDIVFKRIEKQKKETTPKRAIDMLKEAFKHDPDYAHTWHCNIAMMCHDAIHAAGLCEGGPLSAEAPHLIGNDTASRFMKLCFDVETKA